MDNNDWDIQDRQQSYADRTTDQSLESTRRMVRLTHETTQIGVDTMVALDEQEEKLDRIEEGLDDIHAGLKQSERTLNQMERCCGFCLCPGSGNKFSRRNLGAYRRLDVDAGGEESERLITEQPTSGGRSRRAQQGGQFVQRITNDAREDEMDENLGQVSNMLDGLRDMAVDMGDTLERQNDTLDRVTRKAEHNDSHLASVNKQSKRVLRKA